MMPEQTRSSSLPEKQIFPCSCNCAADRDIMLSRSFPPFYSRLHCSCGAQDSGVSMTTNSVTHTDSDKFSGVTSERKHTTADSGCYGVVRTQADNRGEDRNARTFGSSDIYPGNSHYFSDSYMSGNSGDYESHDDKTSVLWEPDEDGDTVLHLAVIHGEVRLVMYLLGLDGVTRWLDHQNHLQQTALHLSVICQHLLITKLLLQQGADPQVRDRHGNTVLHLACRLGDVASVQVVTSRELSAGIRGARCVNLRNYAGLTCLHVAATGGHTHVVRHLLEAPHVAADVNMQDGCSGRTLLHNAVERRDMGLLCYLLQCREDIELDLEAVTFSGHTPLGLAVGNSHHDIVEFLLLAGALPLIPPSECNEIYSDSDSCDSSDIYMDTSDEYTEYTDFVICGKKIVL